MRYNTRSIAGSFMQLLSDLHKEGDWKIMISLMKERFGKRLLYVGLQGSYLRGEADRESDIDIMTVLDFLSVEDLNIYRQVVEENGHAEKTCGFLCGKDELAHWNPCEICHLLHTTKDYYGKLSSLVPSYTIEDERTYLKISLNNLYHELCHRYIHRSPEDNVSLLPYSYKSVFFILQNMYYLKTSHFPLSKAELLPLLQGRDREVLTMSVELKKGSPFDFEAAFSLLFTWCQDAQTSL